MADLLALWHGEHAKFARLLSVLEHQVRRFHMGEQPDYELLIDIVYYLTQYADAVHHPREDVAFARLVEKDRAARAVVDQLALEHRVIGEAGRELLARLNEAEDGALMPRGALEAAASTYLVYYRNHLHQEETVVLPRIARIFTPVDWAEVATAKAHSDDPLFGANVDERFRALRHKIAGEVGIAA